MFTEARNAIRKLILEQIDFHLQLLKAERTLKDECKYAEKNPSIEMCLCVLSDGFLGYINLVWGHYMDNLLLSKVVCQVTRH